MNELNKLRDRISYGIVGLLWINFALIVIRNLVREQGVDWTMILATLALLVPATLLWTRDRTGATTRMVTSMANAATVAVLVFAFQGSPLQIDIHMYFFASLAICAAWIDWKAIIGYAALVAVHHLLLYVAMPLAVFPGDSDFSRVVLHAVVLIVQSIVLIALTSAVVKAFDVSDKAVADAVAAEREAVEMADHVKRTDAAADADRRKREAEKAREAEAVDYAVSELARSLQKLAEGDLSYRIDSAFSGPLDELRTSFNASVQKLEVVVSQVGQVASVLRNGTGQIGQANNDLSARSERQAASVEETASALSSVMATVKETASVADSVGKLVNQARMGAERSGTIVTDAVSAMSRIEQSSQSISNIIGVIDEIAFQTNLLALNAGVEAARAGEAGKGFAVVAQEVRELAQRSANAAKEIKTLINASGEEVRNGVSLVDQAGEALSTIATEVQSISHEISKIIDGAKTQAQGLVEIDQAVGHIDKNTQRNAAMVEELSAAIQQLVQEATTLDHLMAQFKTGSKTGSGARRAA
ncbi:methyl-accepting chemotaxis protein [Rhizobium sp. R86522]|uniref:methyl-accepting chemotaxis protein n=1 Tax=Rhizobium sp. R86522 TaxID=3093861 RepID=UPI00366E73B9